MGFYTKVCIAIEIPHRGDAKEMKKLLEGIVQDHQIIEPKNFVDFNNHLLLLQCFKNIRGYDFEDLCDAIARLLKTDVMVSWHDEDDNYAIHCKQGMTYATDLEYKAQCIKTDIEYLKKRLIEVNAEIHVQKFGTFPPDYNPDHKPNELVKDK